VKESIEGEPWIMGLQLIVLCSSFIVHGLIFIQLSKFRDLTPLDGPSVSCIHIEGKTGLDHTGARMPPILPIPTFLSPSLISPATKKFSLL